MNKLIVSLVLLAGLQSFACADLEGTYYCGDSSNGYPSSVFRVSETRKGMEIEIGLFPNGEEYRASKVAGAGSTRQPRTSVVTKLARCSQNAISVMSNMKDGEKNLVTSHSTHIVKRGNQVTAHYSSVQQSRYGYTSRNQTQEACRKVSMPEDLWVKTKASAIVIYGLMTGTLYNN